MVWAHNYQASHLSVIVTPWFAVKCGGNYKISHCDLARLEEGLANVLTDGPHLCVLTDCMDGGLIFCNVECVVGGRFRTASWCTILSQPPLSSLSSTSCVNMGVGRVFPSKHCPSYPARLWACLSREHTPLLPSFSLTTRFPAAAYRGSEVQPTARLPGAGHPPSRSLMTESVPLS